MLSIQKEEVWTEWTEDGSKHFHDMMGGYILEFSIPLKTSGFVVNQLDKKEIKIGTARVLITDESWVMDKGEHSLQEHIHMDYNDDLNWNQITPYEYLEDALICTHYGKPNGIKGTVAFLETIEIFPPYRGNGLFSPFLTSILNSCRKFKVDYVILQPHPFGKEALRKESLEVGILRLIRFYEQFGFQEIPIEKGVPYMSLPMKLHFIPQTVIKQA